MKTALRITLAASVAMFALPACSADISSSNSAVTYTRAIVHLTKDGVQVQYVDITQADKDAELRQIESGSLPLPAGQESSTQTVTVDSSCASSDAMFFDQSNYGGNELCLYWDGDPNGNSIDLSTITRNRFLRTTWSHAILSWNVHNYELDIWSDVYCGTFYGEVAAKPYNYNAGPDSCSQYSYQIGFWGTD